MTNTTNINTALKTVHKTDCGRVFKNYDMTCPRCVELANGDKPRAGWGDHNKMFEARRLHAIRTHYINGRAACGNVVCTCFEW